MLGDGEPGWVQNAPSRDPDDYIFEVLEEVEDVNARARAETKWESHLAAQGFQLLNVAPTGSVAPDGEGKPVINLDTGQSFANAADAGRSVGLSAGTVSYAARFVRLAGGKRWAFEGDAENQLSRYFEASEGKAVGRPFPREGTSAYRIWTKCIQLNNPENAVLIEAFPKEKPSQIRIEAAECRRAHGWKNPRGQNATIRESQ